MREIGDWRHIVLTVSLFALAATVDTAIGFLNDAQQLTSLQSAIAYTINFSVCISAMVYLNRRILSTPAVRWGVLALVVFFIAAQALAVTERIPALDHLPIIGATSRLHDPSHSILIFCSVCALLVTFHIALRQLELSRRQIASDAERLALEVRERKNAEEHVTRQADRLRLISELALTLSGEPIEVFNRMSRMIGDVLDVKVVCLFEVREDTLHFLSIYRDGEVQSDAGMCPLDITPCATVVSAKDIRVYDQVSTLFPEAIFLKETNAYAYCGIPSLDTRGDVVAVTCLLDDKPHTFSQEDKALLSVFAQRIGAEVERKRHLEERQRTDEARHALEEQMQHTQKLESLGVMAGGIAHDFNNLLAGILGNAELARRRVHNPTETAEFLANISKSSLRAAELCKQLLAYSGKGKYFVEVLDLNEVVNDVQDLLALSISKKARLHTELQPGIPGVEVDPGQLRQILMNLVMNASDAVAGASGEITLRTGTETYSGVRHPDSRLDAPLTPGPYVFVEVADTGAGMSEDTLSKIFDPFFTTKELGRGLGLAAVLGIVRGHQADIRVRTGQDEGAAIRVLFPASERPPVSLRKEDASEEPWQGEGWVLVVDDEELIRKVASKTLDNAGFHVLTASDGQEAIKVFQENKDRICLVLLDLTMPKLSGDETFRALKTIRPDIRVILSSGYSEYDTEDRFYDGGPKGFIQKPYRPVDLVQIMRSALEE